MQYFLDFHIKPFYFDEKSDQMRALSHAPCNINDSIYGDLNMDGIEKVGVHVQLK